MINDNGFVIHLKKYNERSLIIKIFSENNGIVSSFLKKNNGLKCDKYKDQVGNFVKFTHTFKNLENYGNIETNINKNFLNILYYNKYYLLIFNSLISILNNIIIRNENITSLYKIFYNLLFSFDENNKNILLNYVDFLINIVDYTGINIDFSRSIIDNDDVFYISPKTGNCVSKQVGEKYKNKLFIMPKCFVEFNSNVKENINAINILHFFIYKFCKENNIIKKYDSIKFFKNELIKYLKNENKE